MKIPNKDKRQMSKYKTKDSYEESTKISVIIKRKMINLIEWGTKYVNWQLTEAKLH